MNTSMHGDDDSRLENKMQGPELADGTEANPVLNPRRRKSRVEDRWTRRVAATEEHEWNVNLNPNLYRICGSRI